MEEKMQYESPRMEIIEFEQEDIITSSGAGRDPWELPPVAS